MKYILVVAIFFIGFFHISETYAKVVAVVVPESGNLNVLRDKEVYLSFSYSNWGPGWSWISSKRTIKEQDVSAEFQYTSNISSTDTSFTVNGVWRLINDSVLAFRANLIPSGTSELVMAEFALRTGRLFEGTKAIISHKNSAHTEQILPFGRGELGDDISAISLTDITGESINIEFSSPVSIVLDGEARIQIAKDRIVKGRDETISFQINGLGPVKFIPGVNAGRSYAPNKGWYDFSPPELPPSESSLGLDKWLDKPAGKYGRILRDNDRLVYNDKPIKLWGINNSFSDCAPEKELADKRAKFYSFMGINSVRLHKYGSGHGWEGILKKGTAVEFEPVMLDRMDYFVSTLKNNGIYTKLSPVFGVNIGVNDRERIPYMDELGDEKNDMVRTGHGTFYLSTEAQDLLAEQTVNLLNHVNPYTGLKYANDPAIAYIELFNEDSALFFGVSYIISKSKTLRLRAGQMFYDWLREKYTTKQNLLDSWGSEGLNSSVLENQEIPENESWEEKRIYPVGNPWFYDPDNLNTSQRKYKRRLLDTMLFLYELQNRAYARYEKIIRNTGYSGELVYSNWQAGRMMSHYYNLHSDSLGGTIDRHNYFGEEADLPGKFRPATMLSQPGSGLLSSSFQQVKGLPFMLSEWSHVYPNEWGVEGPAILGAYGMGLQGWDVSYAFQNGDYGTYSTAIGRSSWDATSPQFMGIFPAVSRQVLRGDIKESIVEHVRNISVPLLDKQEIGFNERVEQSYDIKTFNSDVFPTYALAAVKGVVKFVEKDTSTEYFDIKPYLHDGEIRSSTNQLVWKSGRSDQDGYIKINTPGTQAVIGFAIDEVANLENAKIISESKFGAIYLTAQSVSGKLSNDSILLTAIARARNKGEVVIDDSVVMTRGNLVKSKPVGPVIMEPVKAKITLKRKDKPTIYILDHGGIRTGKTIPVNKNNTFYIDTGRDKTPYYLIEYT